MGSARELLLELLEDIGEVCSEVFEGGLELACMRQMHSVAASASHDPDIIEVAQVHIAALTLLGACGLAPRLRVCILGNLDELALGRSVGLNLCFGCGLDQKVPLHAKILEVVISHRLLEVQFVLLLDIFNSKMV